MFHIVLKEWLRPGLGLKETLLLSTMTDCEVLGVAAVKACSGSCRWRAEGVWQHKVGFNQALLPKQCHPATKTCSSCVLRCLCNRNLGRWCKLQGQGEQRCIRQRQRIINTSSCDSDYTTVFGFSRKARMISPKLSSIKSPEQARAGLGSTGGPGTRGLGRRGGGGRQNKKQIENDRQRERERDRENTKTIKPPNKKCVCIYIHTQKHERQNTHACFASHLDNED